MPCALPRYYIKESRLLKDRDGIVAEIIAALGQEVNQAFNIPSSSSNWGYDENGDVVWEYDIHGIIGTAKHIEAMKAAKELMAEAREAWPEALLRSGFVSVAMSVNTEGLDDESFANLFREHIRGD